MQKILLVSILLSTLQSQELTPSQVAKVGHYTHSISGKLRYEKRLKKIANLTQNRANYIVQSLCNQRITYSKIDYHASRIFYRVSTPNCKIKIDALDGSVMERR